MRPRKVLFVCTGNSARSQMAEGFARALGQGAVEPHSAGMDPKALHSMAVEVMSEKGIDISHQRSKAFSEELASSMDYVVTVCGNADERCPLLPPHVKRLHWPLEDPARAQGTPQEILKIFRHSCDEIEQLIKQFLGTIN